MFLIKETNTYCKKGEEGGKNGIEQYPTPTICYIQNYILLEHIWLCAALQVQIVKLRKQIFSFSFFFF